MRPPRARSLSIGKSRHDPWPDVRPSGTRSEPRGSRPSHPSRLVLGTDDESRLRCARAVGRGDRRRPRAADLSRLRSELGRLCPRRIRRSAAQALRLGFSDHRALSWVTLYYYGGGFDLLAALAAKLLPFTLFEPRRLIGAAV